MKRRDFLEKWGLSSLKIKLGFLEGEFNPRDPDRAAAWELYVELLTRVTTQSIAPEDGEEQAALDSVYSIFPLTRDILRRHGSGSGEFAKLAIPVLNQIVRPLSQRGIDVRLLELSASRTVAASSAPTCPRCSRGCETTPELSLIWPRSRI
jgi:hypothetical protein